MKIALIYPAFGVVSVVNQPNVKAVADNYGVYPNISMAYVAGALRDSGHELIFLDAMASNYSIDDIIKKLKRFKPKVLMFTMTTYLFHQTLEIITYIKKKYTCKIIVGGAHLSLFPRETLKHKIIDFGIIGEAEETVVELVNSIETKSSFKEVDGIVFNENGRIIITKLRRKIKNLDKIPFPARELLPINKYYSFISKYKNYTIIMTSRGCTFQCSFCEQSTGDIRYRSVKNVVDEMEECVTRFNIKEFDIFDPLFTINKQRVIDICQEIRRRNLSIFWSCRSRVDTITVDMLKEMKKAGCYRIYYGIESGDEKILKNIKKYTKLTQIKKAISLTKKNKILAFGYFMIGCPGETKKSIINTINLAKSLSLDYAQFSRLSTLPGTSLYDELKDKIGYDYWKKYINDKSIEVSLPRIDCKLTDKELNQYIKKAYIEFYFRPKFILKTLISIKSYSEFIRYVKASFGMIFN